MDRKRLIGSVYQSGKSLTMKNTSYRKRILAYLNQKLMEDLGSKGDITTDNIVDKKLVASATIKSKQDGIVCGLEEVLPFYKQNKLVVKANFHDGEKIKKGEVLLTLKGNARTLLKTERTGLNFLQMMSGIATNTRKYVDAIKGFKAKVAATRKCWVDELIEKKAVYVGGALTHRVGLGGAIMIKDNHLKAVELEGKWDYIETVIKRAYCSGLRCGVVVEVKNKEEAILAAHTFRAVQKKNPKMIPIIMLDNMSFSDEKDIVPFINDAALVEASGNVDLKTIVSHAKAGVDVISTSRMNRGASALDLSQKIVKK